MKILRICSKGRRRYSKIEKKLVQWGYVPHFGSIVYDCSCYIFCAIKLRINLVKSEESSIFVYFRLRRTGR